jgi:hypothetical protein
LFIEKKVSKNGASLFGARAEKSGNVCCDKLSSCHHGIISRNFASVFWYYSRVGAGASAFFIQAISRLRFLEIGVAIFWALFGFYRILPKNSSASFPSSLSLPIAQEFICFCATVEKSGSKQARFRRKVLNPVVRGAHVGKG